MATYYELLEVSQTASVEVVQAAYRALSKKYHPDIDQSTGALEKMQKINQARDILCDPVKRKAYDNSIEVRTSQPQQQQTYRKTISNTTNYNPNDDQNLITQRVYWSHQYITYKYIIKDKLYIWFTCEDKETFDKVKEVVKQHFGKWHPEIKYWTVEGIQINSCLSRLFLR